MLSLAIPPPGFGIGISAITAKGSIFGGRWGLFGAVRYGCRATGRFRENFSLDTNGGFKS